ncbi:Tm-1-like ATP-binding domain-containing protein, partial [bacterium]|nr:Tm-1-like ATP-binding domain-containing protein [bacterium]
AVSGMANTTIGIDIGEKPLIGICNVGITTPGAVKAIELLKKRGYDTIVFHGVGTGGRAMEQMMRDGIIGAVFDYATVEISNHIYKGLNDGGPERLTTAGKLGIPQVISPGGIEVLAFWVKEGEPLPGRWKGRKEIRHSSLITTVRCNKEEMLEAAKEVVKRLKYTMDKAVFMIPKGAYSLYSKKGTVFFDPDANSVFADYIKENLPDNFQIIEIDSDLTDPEFVEEGVDQLIKLIESR